MTVREGRGLFGHNGLCPMRRDGKDCKSGTDASTPGDPVRPSPQSKGRMS